MDAGPALAKPVLSGHGDNLELKTAGQVLRLTNLSKVYWPGEGYTKGELIEYYASMAPFILPHLRGFPLVLVRYPDGIAGKHFYQKEAPDHRPPWLPTVEVPSEGRRKMVRYCLAQNEQDLLWLANLGCIETHPWLSRVGNLECPSAMVFDLDPHESQPFSVVIEVARMLKEALDSFGLRSFPKTSGSSGIHVFVPIKPTYSYGTVRDCAVAVARLIDRVNPRVTLERAIKARGTRLYLDCWQIGRGKTLAGVYSIRPRPGAPVSTPLEWNEVREGLKPEDFHMKNLLHRLQAKGDLFAAMLRMEQDLGPLLALAKDKNLR